MARARVWAATLVAAVLMSCEKSPFEPRGEGERVPIGSVIEGRARADSATRYSFTGSPNQPYLIFLESLEGGVHLSVFDSTHGFLTVNLSAFAGGPWLEQNPSNTFGTTSGAVYRLSVRATPPGTTARFRFKVHAIDTRPERVPNSFSFGDTVSGETIHPMFDLDWFNAHGVAGEEIVAVVEPQEPVGSGSVGLSVIDQVDNQFLGYVFADAGAANRLTTGRMRLAGTHDYQFAFGSVTSNMYPRYRGAYRFWTYVIDRAPEHRAAPIPFNTEIGNERIDRAGDVDEFTFQATVGADFNAFLQGSGRAFQLELARQGGTPFAAATSQPSDTALFAHATNRFHITDAGTHVLRVTGSNPYQVADTGAYRLYLYAIDPRPEHVAATIIPGDTVTGEDVGLPGDADEFTFSGVAGEEFNVFLQAQNGSPDMRLQVEVLNATGTVLRRAESVGIDTSLLRQVTGRFALPGTGTYRFRVTGLQPYGVADYHGPYRLLLHRVDRRPESLPDTLTFGDSLSGEAIDVPGDVDEFRVTVPDSSGANLVVQLDAAAPEFNGLSIQLIDLTRGQSVAAVGTGVPGVRAATGRVRLGPGSYLVRVDASQYEDRPVLRGSYRLWLYRFGFGPEAVSDTFAVGDTVSGEVIEPWGDLDHFRFYGLRGQHVNIALQGRADTSGGGFQAWISGPGGEPFWTFASVSSGASDPTLRDHQTMRLDLPVTGWYHVEMTGFGPTRGAYRLLVELVDTSPEQAAGALVPGDSVTTESIDTPGDWDEYTVTAPPEQDLGVLFHGLPGTSGPFPWIRVSDPVTGDSLAANVGQFERIVGPFRMPASGRVTIAVYQPAFFVRFCYDATCGGVFTLVGPYGFHVIPVNRAPETLPAAYVVGDTVRGEGITPIGDLDEFTSSATPGLGLSLHARLLASTVPAGGIIWLDVLDPATGTVLSTGSGLVGGLPDSPFYTLASFVVPASGSLLVRFRGHSGWGDGLATAPYEFVVKPAP
jgi:hypothetical protein